MCFTKSQDVPMTPPIAAVPGDELGASLDASRQPTIASVSRPTTMGRIAEVASAGAYDPTGGEDSSKPPMGGSTKFGALMKVLAPAMHGAAIGGFLGKSTPGGGFAAANNFYLQQRMRQMQMAQFMQQMELQRSTIAKNQAEAQWAQRRPLVTRTGPAIKGKDAQGNDIYLTQNPSTGEYEKQEGITPAPGPVKEVPTDQGLVTYDPTNPQKGAIPLTLAGKAADTTREGSAESASEPSARASGGVVKFGNKISPMFRPRVPGASEAGSPAASPATTAIPLHGPNFGKPKPSKVTNRNASGAETDNLIDENPDSPTFGKPLKSNVASRAPLPEKGPNAPKNVSDIETYAGEALKRSGNDPDKAIEFMNSLKTGDAEADKKLQSMLPKIRQSIRDRVKPSKKKLTLSPEDQKAAGLSPTQSSVTGEEPEEENP